MGCKALDEVEKDKIAWERAGIDDRLAFQKLCGLLEDGAEMSATCPAAEDARTREEPDHHPQNIEHSLEKGTYFSVFFDLSVFFVRSSVFICSCVCRIVFEQPQYCYTMVRVLF